MNFSSNTNNAKNARKMVSLYYSAVMGIADAIAQNGDEHDKLVGCIATNRHLIEKFENGELNGVTMSGKTETQVREELAEFEESLEVFRENLVLLQDQQKKDKTKAIEWINGVTIDGVGDFIKSCDFEMSDTEIEILKASLRGNTSVKEKVTSGKCRRDKKGKSLATDLLSELADRMLEVKQINPYKFSKDAIEYAEKKAKKKANA